MKGKQVSEGGWEVRAGAAFVYPREHWAQAARDSFLRSPVTRLCNDNRPMGKGRNEATPGALEPERECTASGWVDPQKFSESHRPSILNRLGQVSWCWSERRLVKKDSLHPLPRDRYSKGRLSLPTATTAESIYHPVAEGWKISPTALRTSSPRTGWPQISLGGEGKGGTCMG